MEIQNKLIANKTQYDHFIDLALQEDFSGDRAKAKELLSLAKSTIDQEHFKKIFFYFLVAYKSYEIQSDTPLKQIIESFRFMEDKKIKEILSKETELNANNSSIIDTIQKTENKEENYHTQNNDETTSNKNFIIEQSSIEIQTENSLVNDEILFEFSPDEVFNTNSIEKTNEQSQQTIQNNHTYETIDFVIDNNSTEDKENFLFDFDIEQPVQSPINLEKTHDTLNAPIISSIYINSNEIRLDESSSTTEQHTEKDPEYSETQNLETTSISKDFSDETNDRFIIDPNDFIIQTEEVNISIDKSSIKITNTEKQDLSTQSEINDFDQIKTLIQNRKPMPDESLIPTLTDIIVLEETSILNNEVHTSEENMTVDFNIDIENDNTDSNDSKENPLESFISQKSDLTHTDVNLETSTLTQGKKFKTWINWFLLINENMIMQRDYLEMKYDPKTKEGIFEIEDMLYAKANGQPWAVSVITTNS